MKSIIPFLLLALTAAIPAGAMANEDAMASTSVSPEVLRHARELPQTIVFRKDMRTGEVSILQSKQIIHSKTRINEAVTEGSFVPFEKAIGSVGNNNGDALSRWRPGLGRWGGLGYGGRWGRWGYRGWNRPWGAWGLGWGHRNYAYPYNYPYYSSSYYPFYGTYGNSCYSGYNTCSNPYYNYDYSYYPYYNYYGYNYSYRPYYSYSSYPYSYWYYGWDNSCGGW